MRALVINMAAARRRMAFMDGQLNALGIPFERIEAVTPATLDPPADAAVWKRWQRPLRTTEMALCASHIRAWRRVLDLGEPCLVLEDDALLSADTPAFLLRLAMLSGVDHVSLETRSRKKIVGRRMHAQLPMRRLWQDRTGSAAYIVFPSGANKLIAHATRLGGPSDAVISSAYALCSFQADPALSVQLDQAPAYGLAAAIETQSLIDAEKKPSLSAGLPFAERFGYRRRRILAQLRMGLRQLVHLADGERRHIPFSPVPPPDRGDIV